MHEFDKNPAGLKHNIRRWGTDLGFDAIGFSGTHVGDAEQNLSAWLAAGCHGDMDYMAAYGADAVTGKGSKRALPTELVPGTLSIITARMNYRSASAVHGDTATHNSSAALADGERAFISRYALGRDYHKLLRGRLQQLADRITREIGNFSYRAFTDSAPVMEVGLAQNSGLGWRGKHTLLLERDAGSYFFLGELFTDLALPPDAPVTDHCGTCTACLTACPTQAIVAPYRLDARLCISYLTIELKGSIPEPLRPLLGNRIYGCDDCQLACPWNRFAPLTRESDFAPRHQLDRASLVELFAWEENDFNERLAGSPIRRIGFERWLRNIAVALGNAPTGDKVLNALRSRADHPSALVREHVQWALRRHEATV
ncbi:MAG: tRNA epoxyqueuosine(34) reductase QueG [Sulfuritalea sp.]|nr:tRNA epoxyqueuosine(34) reductase QueG [Sulfuritalea sp.]